MSVTSGQAVLVNAEITIGTTNPAGATGLRLWICYQPNGGTLTTPHAIDWIDAQTVQNMLAVYPITDTITGLATGSYTVGLCGQQSGSVTNNWNLEDWAYTTAQVIGGASILSSANEQAHEPHAVAAIRGSGPRARSPVRDHPRFEPGCPVVGIGGFVPHGGATDCSSGW